MKVLIAGAGGQIGRALAAGAPPGVRISAPGRSDLDITRPDAVHRVVGSEAPDLILNAAGYTAVDRAESEPDQARAVNEGGARSLAEAAAAAGARMLHYSTDYVFDGAARRPYSPEDSPNPINTYGLTKLAGERAVLGALGNRAVVVRTAWVYAAHGHNFLRTMLRLLNEREKVNVVADQIGTPTSAVSAARVAWAVAARDDVHGVLHWTDDGTASWFDFAAAIRDEAVAAGILTHPAEIVPVTSAEYPTPARRPFFSVLDCSEARAALGQAPDYWRVALRGTIQQVANG